VQSDRRALDGGVPTRPGLTTSFAECKVLLRRPGDPAGKSWVLPKAHHIYINDTVTLYFVSRQKVNGEERSFLLFSVQWDGAPGEIRTPDPLLRRCAVQNSKCRSWCRLRGNASLISLLNWTEVELNCVGWTPKVRQKIGHTWQFLVSLGLYLLADLMRLRRTTWGWKWAASRKRVSPWYKHRWKAIAWRSSHRLERLGYNVTLEQKAA